MNATDTATGALQKTPTGISGLDEITGGGLPMGRPTLITGGAGTGKTMIGLEFLVRGVTEFEEPGVFVAFEETAADLAANFASRGYDLAQLEHEQKLIIDHVYIERSEIAETGEYDLEPLFIRIGDAIDTIGARRVVLDTIEVLFSGLTNTGILRAELRRLFRFLKEKGVTAIVTGERGDQTSLSRYGLEEFVADCVIVLDHRIIDQIATRRLRVVKYRGSSHATNEFPFLINDDGLSVLPITSLGLTHVASTERVSSGVPALDEMLGGKGYYRGSSILVSGSAGSGKTSLAASFALAACKRGEKALYFAFEKSESQLTRNMNSVGIELAPYCEQGQMKVAAVRSTQYGLETHLAVMVTQLASFQPSVVVVDPITNLRISADELEIQATFTRLIDYLKSNNITSLFTSLTGGEEFGDEQGVGVSNFMDSLISIRNVEDDGERNRILYVLKSRGMSHSNQMREYVLSDDGPTLVERHLGPDGDMLLGSARAARQMALESAAETGQEARNQQG